MSEQSTYNLTVLEFRAYLDKMIEAGHGDALIVHSAHRGKMPMPICELVSGGLTYGNGSGWVSDQWDENGDGYVFIMSAEMLPVGFWKRNAEQRASEAAAASEQPPTLKGEEHERAQ